MSWRRAIGARRLLVSGFGKWGGGVYDLTSDRPVALDDLPTSGLAVGGGRLWRVLRAPGEQTASCELLAYDDRGVRSYQRLDTIRDPHDLCWHDGAIHVASSWDGTVWRVGADGTPQAVWQGGTVPDSWHVNSLVVVDGRLHVCAFGRLDQHKAWKTPRRAGTGASSATADAGGPPPRPAVQADSQADGHTTHQRWARPAIGFVHDISRGEDVLDGLAHPHAPRWAHGRWYLCESTQGALTELAADGRVLRRASLRRFSRGLALMGRWALVGGNAHRDADDDRAEIVVVDLRSFDVVERIAMPCLEIYDILTVPSDLARAVAMGFGANPARTVEQHRGTVRDAAQHPAPPEARVQLATPEVAARLAAAGEVLDPEVAARCTVRGRLPARVTAGESRLLTMTVENRSELPLASVAPKPVRVGARWFPHGRRSSNPDGSDDATVRNPVTPLPRLLWPGDRVETEVLLAVPDQPGRYEVRVALHQPDVGWFGVRSQGTVVVVPAPEAAIGSVLLGAEGGEQHHVADGVGVGQEHDQPVDAKPQPAGGR